MSRYEIRPIGTWTDPVTDPRSPSHLFRATWSDTLDLLEYETGQLGADLVVLQVDAREYDIRRDGMLRADAKVGPFPGVRVSFESMHGPLTYATDEYDRGMGGSLPGWQANIRAIALALKALRAVDRYGVSRRGEQYRGWTAISNRPAEMTREQAAEFIFHMGGGVHRPADILDDPAGYGVAAYRAAAMRVHPDRTGDDGDTMARLNQARDLLLNGSRT